MATFWIIATLLMLLALAFVILPLLRKHFPIDKIDQRKINISIYQERLAELVQENLSQEQFIESKQELEKILVQELPDQTPAVQKPKAVWISVVVIALFVPIFTVTLYHHFGQPHYLTASLSETSPSLPANFSDMVTQLAHRLEKEPNDAEGWEMLAHSYVTLERYPEAAQAYKRLLALGQQQNPDILVDYAEVLALVDQGQFGKESLESLQTALKIAPNHQEALWLLGLASVQMTDYQNAVGYWERLQVLLPAEAGQAKQQLAEQLVKVKQLAQQNQAFATPATTETTALPAKDRSLTVAVSIAPHLLSQIQPHSTVFIYARAQTGSPMPLAIVKKLATDLPSQVILDDNTTLNPEMPLSHFPSALTVIARVSKNGNATAQSGDLQGKVENVLRDQQKIVTVVIDQVIP